MLVFSYIIWVENFNMQKPEVVSRINFLLGLSFLINVVFGLFNLIFDTLAAGQLSAVFLISFVIALSIKAYWYYRIYQGSEIAKNLYVWIGSVALPIVFVVSFYVMYAKSFFDGLEHLILSAIGLVVVCLMMTAKAKSWYHAQK